MAGALFENYIIQETLKSFINKGKQPNIYYIRTHNELEIDIIIEKSMKLFPIEIKLTKSPTINMMKNIDRFNDLFSKLRIENGKIVCLSDNDDQLTKNVSVSSINSYLKWLKELI